MSKLEVRPVPLTIRGPLQRNDLPGLYARVCALFAANPGATLVCDVTEVAIDAVAVEALARLRLGARRHGCGVRLVSAPRELIDLASFMGLGDVVAA
jgi:ABC-type transporter Mla MlaB component